MRSMVTVHARGALRHALLDPAAAPTVAAAHEALALPAPPSETSGTPLRHGASLPGSAASSPRGPARLVVSAGPDAGGSVELRPGAWVTVGRAATCDLVVDDPSLSRRHLRVRLARLGVQVEDLGSTNGLRWRGQETRHRADPGRGRDGCGPGASGAGPPGSSWWPTGADLLAGATRLELVLEPPPPLEGRDVAGRVAVRPWPRPPVELAPRQLRTPPAPAEPVLRPLSAWAWALPLVASVVAAAVLRMPMILVFGLMAPAMVLGHHVGGRRASRREHREALARHAAALADLDAERERALRADLHARRRRDPGPLGVALAWQDGATALLWSRGGEPPTVVLGEGVRTCGVSLDGVALEHDAAPVTLTLDRPVALVGPPALTAAAARSWLLQLATGLPPSHLAVVVEPGALPGAQWDLLAWLPHTCPERRPGPAHTLVWGSDLLVHTRAGQVPQGVPQLVLTDTGSAVLRCPGEPDQPLRPALMALPLARHLARGLAPLVEEGAQDGAAAPTLGDLAPWPLEPDAVRAGWGDPAVDLRVVLGTDEAGAPAEVDLAADGPHALVAGTTGSGKSELLRTLVTSLALRNPPSRLGMLLVDYKGGSSLGECAALPHSCGLVTDLDPHLAQRVLVSLAAELRRRESVLAAAGARDVREHPDLPRLVVVIDEFRVLAEELPELLDGLVHLAAVGRSLGVHLVLATQRPAGVVSADLRANVNLRIALRVRDRADSLDVLESPEAAELPEGRPGLALLRTGASPPRRVQVAPAAPGSTTAAGPHALASGPGGPAVEPVADAWEGWLRLQSASPRAGTDSSLVGLTTLLSQVAQDQGERPAAVWRPPLPARIPEDVAPGAWALADHPESQSQEPVAWRADGHLAVVGAARTGRSTAVRSLLAACGPCWLYVVDLARDLEETEVAAHPGLRAWVGPHEAGHGLRVLEAVVQILEERNGTRTQDGAPVVLVVDGWDRLLEAYRDVGGGRARDLVLRILRDGPGAGVVAILTGSRSLLAGPVAAEVPQLWALHLHDPADLVLAGLRRHQVPSQQPPGRAVRTRDGLVAQVLLPQAGPDAQRTAPAAPAGDPPPRLRSLPAGVALTDGWAVGGEEAAPLPVPSGSLLVLGPPGSGVSSTLATLAAARAGGEGAGADPLRVAADDLGPDGVERLDRALQAHRGPVIVDDAHLLAGTRAEDLLLGWSARTGGDLLVGGELEACSGLFRGLVVEVARHRSGVVLQPAQPSQGALLGVRLPVEEPRVPGRGLLVGRGRCTPIQVAAPRPGGP